VQFGAGHDCGWLTGKPAVDRDECLSSWITSG
jgi:hypothetical protein